jgi:sulfide:quinone oxidoreductase
MIPGDNSTAENSQKGVAMGGRILILGAGFGGLEAATRLRAALDESYEITIVDRNDFFNFGFTKFDLMFGRRAPEDCKESLSALEDQGIRFLQATIESIDPEGKQVVTSEGSLAADHLVVALGADIAPEETPGFLESGGHHFYSFAAAEWLWPLIDEFQSGQILIAIFDKPYKCPPAPYEAAFQLDDFYRDRGIRQDVGIDILIPGPIPLPISETISAGIEKLLTEKKIGLHKKHKVAEVDYRAKQAVVANGTRFPYDLFLGVPIHRPPAVVLDSPLGEQGWIRVDPATMRSSFDGVWAMGDVVQIPIGEYAVPKAGAFAEDAAATVAADILRSIHGQGEVGPFQAQGACYFEFGEGKVAQIAANFLGGPTPDLALEGPTLEFRADKEEFERSRIEKWFGK